jgi:hypothetical protein
MSSQLGSLHTCQIRENSSSPRWKSPGEGLYNEVRNIPFQPLPPPHLPPLPFPPHFSPLAPPPRMEVAQEICEPSRRGGPRAISSSSGAIMASKR